MSRQETVVPMHYPAELRRSNCERTVTGEAVKNLIIELGIAEVLDFFLKSHTECGVASFN
jgi:hypothetical protein